MNTKIKKNIVIAGGGTAGWMTACALSKQMGHALNITLVESDQIGTVGVGEATIPTMQTFHMLLGLDEAEFMRETQATFKLGIHFENWGGLNESYLHAFGETGREFWAGQFQHFWLRGQKEGIDYPFSDFSTELQAAYAGKFAVTKNPRINYAYHLDATLYAKFLRKISERQGVNRIEGKIDKVELDSASGGIKALKLESGQSIEGDLFVDCTGFRGLLIEQALHTGYEDWSHLFLCDSAVATQTHSVSEPVPYTKSIAHPYGWQWRIPLQHRVGNGLVYSSKYLSDDEAISLLKGNIEGERINEPRVIRFKPGVRRKQWNKNCIAIGLSSGFIEPLESTSIHLISSSIVRLMRMMPSGEPQAFEVDEFNRQAMTELQSIRDFIALHYKVNHRGDSEFWRYCEGMQVPDSLSRRLALYQDSASLHWGSDELFTVNSWNQVMLGQGIEPQSYHPACDAMERAELERFLSGYRKSVQDLVGKMPSHSDFIAQYCKALS